MAYASEDSKALSEWRAARQRLFLAKDENNRTRAAWEAANQNLALAQYDESKYWDCLSNRRFIDTRDELDALKQEGDNAQTENDSVRLN